MKIACPEKLYFEYLTEKIVEGIASKDKAEYPMKFNVAQLCCCIPILNRSGSALPGTSAASSWKGGRSKVSLVMWVRKERLPLLITVAFFRYLHHHEYFVGSVKRSIWAEVPRAEPTAGGAAGACRTGSGTKAAAHARRAANMRAKQSSCNVVWAKIATVPYTVRNASKTKILIAMKTRLETIELKKKNV